MRRQDMEYFWRKLCVLQNINLFKWEKKTGELTEYGGKSEEVNVLAISEKLKEELTEKAAEQRVPLVFRDGEKILYGCMRLDEEVFLLAGPVCLEEMDYVEVHQYYRQYGIGAEREKQYPAKLSLCKFLTVIELLHFYRYGEEVSDSELMEKNCLTQETKNVQRKERTEMGEYYHHTYQEELEVMNCVREGRLDEVESRVKALGDTAGKLSENEMNAERNLGICSVTLAARAAIEGGVSPAESYQLSDIYINKIDQCQNIVQLYKYRLQSMYDFTKLVAEERRKHRHSRQVEMCRDYIHKNYHHKICVGEIAEALGISESYLSRKFKSEMGISIQEYITEFRIERAENLLKYSEASLSDISDYLSFFSQSHFGRVFKKYTGMTPGQYRESYKPKEFIT